MKTYKATKKDLKEYTAMKKSSMEFLFKISGEKISLSNDGIKKEFEKILSQKGSNLLILEIGGGVAGYMIYTMQKNTQKSFAYLDDIFIKKDFRKQGYGKKLVKHFMEIAKEKGIKKMGLGVRVENKNAIKLYRELGFKIIGYNFGLKR